MNLAEVCYSVASWEDVLGKKKHDIRNGDVVDVNNTVSTG